ncbi:MAG: spore photoproduct lyase [Clostridiaceae bacterium]
MVSMFKPKRIIFEEKALDYKMGEDLLYKFKGEDVEILYSKSGRITGIPGKDTSQMYGEGKSTLVVGIRKSLKFESCKPSAHYQLPIVSGCTGMCEYCYLNTQMGKKPYIKIHVNIEDILNRAEEYIEGRKPEVTIFEGSATSDPIPVEKYSGALKKSIEFFGKNDYALFRFVTKYTDVDDLLNLKHNGKTIIRFSLNSETVINRYEHRTPSLEERLIAARKIGESGYPLGFIIAPVFLYEDWKRDYLELINKIYYNFRDLELKFEVISHRFTKRAKENILTIYPNTALPMEEDLRKFKFGQFGYGKYIYKDEDLRDMKEFFKNNITDLFGEHSINYII